MVALTPLVTSTTMPERMELAAAESWTAAYSEHLEQLVEAAAREAETADRIAIDLANVEEIDTLGAWLLEGLSRRFKSNGKEGQFTRLKPHYRGLINEMQRVNLEPRTSPARPNRVILALDRIGRASLGLASDVGEFLHMLGELGVVIVRILLDPRAFASPPRSIT
jgi:phospholipid/cholesterol/gamma-HCH transport system permease protein